MSDVLFWMIDATLFVDINVLLFTSVPSLAQA